MLCLDTDALHAWAEARFGRTLVRPHAALGWEREGRLAAVALFENFKGAGGNIDMHFYIEPPLMRGFMRALWRYCFEQLGCGRVTMCVPQTLSAQFPKVERLGFVPETWLPEYLAGGEAALQFVIYRSAVSKWMNGHASEQPQRPSSA